MKVMVLSILVAAALVTASASGMAAAEGAAASNGATSVAEMMQRKQDRQLRAQLVTEGRSNKVRQMDESDAIHMREKQEYRYAKVNEVLGRTGNVGGPDRGPLLDECDPVKLR